MEKYPNVDPQIFYSRYLIWNNFAGVYDKILHLDLHILVMKPLDGLFALDEFTIFQDKYDGSDSVFYDKNNSNLRKLLKKDNILIPNSAANAGVFLVPKKYETKKDYDTLIYITKRYKEHLIWADQSAINIWLAKEKIPIKNDDRYNFQIFRLTQLTTFLKVKDAYIIHFMGFSAKKKFFIMKLSYFLTCIPFGLLWLTIFLMVIRCPGYLKRRLGTILFNREM